MSDLARLLMIAGAILLALGLVLWLGPKIPWLGKLPGDITYKRDNFTVYFPLGTCILLSVILSLIVYLFRK
ncbi:MAG: DUF2905 domain-containing protein [Syntrophales bacterium]|nr:DUF2905 domain-containing protein [Syntrophales bacterium]MDD5642719.1 DUF2905 domain-containing protein [Syntrophales bacterium]